MMIEYAFDKQGGFHAVDEEAEIYTYAFPTSVYANAAKNKPSKVAWRMVEDNRSLVATVKNLPFHRQHVEHAKKSFQDAKDSHN